MIRIDNIEVLRQENKTLLDNLKKLEQGLDQSNVSMTQAKNGLPNLEVTVKEKSYLVHSAYDPMTEAERFLDKFEPQEVEKFEHVFFYGIGMGYHIRKFMERFPKIPFTIYEPNPFVFYQFTATKKLSDFPLNRLKHLFVEFTPEFLGLQLNQFMERNKDQVLLVTLPSYERIFQEQYARFVDQFREVVLNRRTSMYVNLAFEKRWSINSLIQMHHVFKNESILAAKKEYFKDKPAIIVSAGPSLQEEIENLRAIKKNGSAYIFAVGSSIKALLEHEIKPDAVCSYDPQGNTVETYQQIINENITDIPLIYGSSVGFETFQQYPGPKFHMITNQDRISPLYLKHVNDQPIEQVADAPSIAVVTLELLYKLGANPIILVGQNFAYKNNQFYAQGISYSTPTQKRTTELSEAELAHAVEADGVDGGKVLTTEGFNRMRKHMEHYAAQFSDREIINTTQGGAKIEHTKFVPLEQLVKERLAANAVDPNWLEKRQDSVYDIHYFLERCKELDMELDELHERIRKVGVVLRELEIMHERGQYDALESTLQWLDKEYKKLGKNRIFEAALVPMNRVLFELFAKNVSAVRFERDPQKKVPVVLQSMGSFLQHCNKDLQDIGHVFRAVHTMAKIVS